MLGISADAGILAKEELPEDDQPMKTDSLVKIYRDPDESDTIHPSSATTGKLSRIRLKLVSDEQCPLALLRKDAIC